jgi:hypothetical protein
LRPDQVHPANRRDASRNRLSVKWLTRWPDDYR